MNWNKFDTKGDSKEKAFEIMSNQIFKEYCEEEYQKNMKCFIPINGAGGDGGIEAYTELSSGKIVAIQSKWFPEAIGSKEISQLRNSIKTAIDIRKNIEKYIVSVPRDLANKKNGKNGIVKNTERKRVEDLFKEFENTKIKFEIWGEFELSSFLTTRPNLAGVYKFWFDNSEIDFSTIINSLETQKNGWLKDRYSGKLHVVNSINYKIEELVGNVKQKKSEIIKLNDIKQAYIEYLTNFKKYLEIVSLEIKVELLKIYEEQCKIFEKTEKSINEVIQSLKDEKEIWNIDGEGLLIDTSFFESIEKEHNFYTHYRNLEESIKKINNINLKQYLKQIEDKYKTTVMIITGELGSGKTHGVVNQIEKEIAKKNIAILIRASDIEDNSNWKEILVKALGISSDWSEEEIWDALSSLAFRNECNKQEDNEIMIHTKILICFDGIDECNNYKYWEEKIKEAKFLTKKNNRLRFCFIGREYAFKKEELQNYKVLNYDYDLEYDMNDMYNKYIKENRINIVNSINLKSYLTNPLVLKLFCERYKNSKIDTLEGIKVNLADLFKIKLNEMNTEFKCQNKNIECNDIISRSSLIIGNYLYENEKITQNRIYELLNQDEEINILSGENKKKIIRKLQEYGLLHVKRVEKDLGILEDTYYKGMQPVIDYIIALNLAKNIHNKKTSEIHENIKYNTAILGLCALILLEENNTLLSDIKDFKIDRYTLSEAISYAIVNANPFNVQFLKERIKKSLLTNPNNMREILNNIITLCARVENHPLGAELLHEVLNNFKSMAERDKIWSLPEHLSNINFRIDNELLINKYNPTYYLNKEDKHNGLPLIYAWLLTSVNNQKLYFYRNQIMKWAIDCPDEFFLLLEKCKGTTDVQMLEQLYGIAMCLCYKTKDRLCIKKMMKIIDENLYEKDIIKTFDFNIRFYIRAIAEKAFKYGILDNKNLRKYLPPYKCNIKLDLNKDATKGTRMGGYGSIDYDLARYVLSDYLEHRFFKHYNDYNNSNKIKIIDAFSEEDLLANKENLKSNHEYMEALKELESRRKQLDIIDFLKDKTIEELEEVVKNDKEKTKQKEKVKKEYGEKTENFLKEKSEELNLENLTHVQYAIAVAYQYLLDNGWNEDEFYGKDKIDSIIRYQYYSATHGEKSNVMTFTEKYVWCARNQIIGYLADTLYQDKQEEKKYTNYTQIDDVLIPITEYEENSKEEKENNKQFIPEDVFKNCEIKSNEDLKKWINSDEITINLKKWICTNNYVVLNSLNTFTNIKNDIDFNMWISAGIIKEKDMIFLYDNIEKYQLRIKRLVNNPDDFSEYTISDGSRTPFEIVNFDWYSVLESTFENISLLNNMINRYHILKTFESAYNVHTEFTEIHYRIPSAKIRNMLNIVDVEEFKYKDKDGNIVAYYETNNKQYEDIHNILVADKIKLEKELHNKNEKMIWIFRIEKELSMTGKEKYRNINDYHNILGICWYDNDELITKFIKEE